MGETWGVECGTRENGKPQSESWSLQFLPSLTFVTFTRFDLHLLPSAFALKDAF